MSNHHDAATRIELSAQAVITSNAATAGLITNAANIQLRAVDAQLQLSASLLRLADRLDHLARLNIVPEAAPAPNGRHSAPDPMA